MLTQQTLSQLKALKLDGMARAFEEQVSLTASSSLSFEERFGIVVDRELAWRDTRRLERLMKAAKLKNRKRHLKAVSTSTLRVSKVMSITSSSGDHFDDRDRQSWKPQGAAELRA